MRGALAVAAREIAERRLLFLGAFVVGLLPLGVFLIPVLRGNPREARSVAVLLVGATIAVAFPIAFGATTLVSDIAQKRLAFYFSRPLPAASIWAGKLLAALVISIGCVLLAVVPVFLVEGESAFSSDTGGLFSRSFLSLGLPGILFLLLLAHVVASMARLRSVWIVLDFLLAVVFAVAIALSIRSLFFAGFWDFYENWRSPSLPVWWLPVVLTAILLAATCAQVVDGRTDARRSHGALSATLWGLTALLALPLAGLAWWVGSAGPGDLVAVEQGLQAAPRGTWVALGGKVRSRGSARASFLYDTASGRYVKHRGWAGMAFSADGSRAAWAEGRVGFLERGSGTDVFIADLGSAKLLEPGLTCGPFCRVALSPSGHRLAVSDGSTLSSYEISDPSNPKQIAAIRVEAAPRQFAFVDEDTIRVFPRFFNANRKDLAPRDLEIEEVSLLSKKSLVTGRLERDLPVYLRMSADGRYLVGSGKNGLTLLDGRTGALVATPSGELENPRLRFLSGDRLAVAGIAGASARLLFFEGEKARVPARSIDLGPAASVVLGAEVAPGRVAVALNPFRSNDERSRRAWKLAFVDVTTGAVTPGPDGLVPADRFGWWFSPVMPPAESGSPAAKLFLDASGALVRLDPASGRQEILLGGRR